MPVTSPVAPETRHPVDIASCPELCARHGTTRRHALSSWRLCARFARLAIRTISGIAVLALLLGIGRVVRPLRRVAPWYLTHLYRRILRICRVRLEIAGPDRRFGRTALVVANHVSWLDVVALGAVQPVRTTSQTSGWPLIGAFAAWLDTMLLDRQSLDDVAVTRAAAALRRGATVAAFPEGCTTCGRGIGAFRPAMFQAAIDAGVPVRPVALAYLDRDRRPTTAASFVGDMSLLQSARCVLQQDGMTVRLELLPLIEAAVTRGLCARAHQLIASANSTYVADPIGRDRPVTCRAVPPVLMSAQSVVTGTSRSRL